MAEECDPNQTSRFEVKGPGGWIAQFTSKRMAEWLSLLSLIIMASLVSVAYLQYKELQALGLAVKAAVAEMSARQAETSASLRELACISMAAEKDRAHCKTVARMQ